MVIIMCEVFAIKEVYFVKYSVSEYVGHFDTTVVARFSFVNFLQKITSFQNLPKFYKLKFKIIIKSKLGGYYEKRFNNTPKIYKENINKRNRCCIIGRWGRHLFMQI